MKTIVLGIVSSVAVGLLLGQPPGWPPRPMPPEIVPDLSRDIVKLAPQQYTVELENEQVRVLRARLGPEETAPIHDAQAGVLVALTEAHVSFIRPDKHMQQADLKPGQVQWIFEDTYSAKNLRKARVEFLFIEMRPRRAYIRPVTL